MWKPGLLASDNISSRGGKNLWLILQDLLNAHQLLWSGQKRDLSQSPGSVQHLSPRASSFAEEGNCKLLLRNEGWGQQGAWRGWGAGADTHQPWPGSALIGWSAGCPGDSSWGGGGRQGPQAASELPPRGVTQCCSPLSACYFIPSLAGPAHKLGEPAKAELPDQALGCKGGARLG